MRKWSEVKQWVGKAAKRRDNLFWRGPTFARFAIKFVVRQHEPWFMNQCNDALKHWYLSPFDNLRSNLLVVWLTLPFSKSHKMFQNWEEATFYLFMLTPTWLLQHLQESENSTFDQESVLTSAIWKYIKNPIDLNGTKWKRSYQIWIYASSRIDLVRLPFLSNLSDPWWSSLASRL